MRWLGRIPAQSVAMQLERYSRKSLAVAIVHSPSSRERFPPSSYIFSQKVTRASGQEWYIAITKTKTSYKKVLNFRRKSPNLLNELLFCYPNPLLNQNVLDRRNGSKESKKMTFIHDAFLLIQVDVVVNII